MASFQAFKDKALPYLVTVIVGMVWYDIREMRNDIKSLLQQTADNRVRIESLERSLYTKTAYRVPQPPGDHDHKPLRYEMVAVLRDENLTIEEYETSNRRAKRKLLEHI